MITDEEFDERLERMVGRMSAAQILSYGEVRTILAEELNNDIIEEWENDNAVKMAEKESAEEEGPQEDDITTSDRRVWYQYGKTYFIGDEGELKWKMDQDKFWPNVWFISDHGNPILIQFED